MAVTALAAAALIAGLEQGRSQRIAARKGLAEQQKAQEQAESAALAEARTAEQERAKANQRAPDIPSLLSSSRRPSSSLFAGPLGADQSLLQLGKPKLLGE